MKARIDRLAVITARMAKRASGQATPADGLPTFQIAGQSFHEVPGEQWARVGDMLLGMGGPTAWAAAQTVGWGLDTTRDAEIANDLAGLGFVMDGGFWHMPTPEAEAQFLSDWLAIADQAGRTVIDRAMIEQWVRRAKGDNTAFLPSAGPTPEPYSAPAVDFDKVVAQRARERDGITEDNLAAWKKAARSSEPKPHDDIQDALIRRQNRRAKRRWG